MIALLFCVCSVTFKLVLRGTGVCHLHQFIFFGQRPLKGSVTYSFKHMGNFLLLHGLLHSHPQLQEREKGGENSIYVKTYS